MATTKLRDYNCKDEELPVVCGFASFSVKRDLGDFVGYSPKFNPMYINEFDTQIMMVKDLVAPHSEVVQQKVITERLYASMNGLSDPSSRLAGYVEMVYETMRFSATDFGISALRKAIYAKDPEGVLNSLREVNANIITYGYILTPQGLTEPLIQRFTDASLSIAADVQQRYEINSNRRNIIQANIGTFNALYANLCDILNVGKILYQFTDAVKKKEYAFAQLMKSVRRVTPPVVSPVVEAGSPVNPLTA